LLGAARYAQPQPQPPALTAAQRSELERWWATQEKVAMPFANDGAKVLVVKFNDYQCPPCRQSYYGYEPVLAKFKPSDVKYVMKHFPLDPSCNSAVTNLLHPVACDAAAAAVMARSKGTVDQLTAWFFAHQEELNPATVRTAAKDVGGVSDFAAAYPKAIQEVKTDASIGGVLQVQWTPTFFINGRRIPRGVSLSPQLFEALLELELQRPK
jgi:protein-disulfide isomerase